MTAPVFIDLGMFGGVTPPAPAPTPASLSVTETQMMAVLRSFIQGLIAGVEVVRLPNNRVPMPASAFIALTPARMNRLATNIVASQDGVNQLVGLMQKQQRNVQIDCYGPSSCEWATIIATALRDPYGTATFAASGYDVTPLYSTEPTQLPLVDGEQQYEERWTFEAALQLNPILTLPQQSAVPPYGPVDLINVDATYGA
jgi:hypothetical protein